MIFPHSPTYFGFSPDFANYWRTNFVILLFVLRVIVLCDRLFIQPQRAMALDRIAEGDSLLTHRLLIYSMGD